MGYTGATPFAGIISHNEVGIVLAGGKSTRIGRDKAFLEVGGMPLVERVLLPLAGLLPRLYIVTSRPAPVRDAIDALVGTLAGARVEVIEESACGFGPLGGLKVALEALAGLYGNDLRALVVGCDMPFLDVELLRWLLEASRESRDADVHVPLWSAGLEPLHAVYSARCLPHLADALGRGRRRMVSFYSSVVVAYLDVEKHFSPARVKTAFFNINTPAELEQANACEKARNVGERSSDRW